MRGPRGTRGRVRIRGVAPSGGAGGRPLMTPRGPAGAPGCRDGGGARSRTPRTTAAPTRPASGRGTRAGARRSTRPCAGRSPRRRAGASQRPITPSAEGSGAQETAPPADGIECGVGLATEQVYEPANSPAAAARISTSTPAGSSGECRNAAQRCARVGGLRWPPWGVSAIARTLPPARHDPDTSAGHRHEMAVHSRGRDGRAGEGPRCGGGPTGGGGSPALRCAATARPSRSSRAGRGG